MIIKHQSIRIIREEISPEEHGKALADDLFWEFNKSLDEKMTNEEAQMCVDSFVIQLYRRFNLQGYNLDIEELIRKVKDNDKRRKIQEAAEHYEQVDATNLACDYGWGDCDIQQQCFKAGVEWADQHPRKKGLWDAEKVVKWILENANKHIWYDETENECGITDNFIEDLQKAMEEKKNATR